MMVTVHPLRVAVAFALVGAACLIVAFMERHITNANTPAIGIEGAYFDRSVGGTHSIVSVSGNWLAPFKPLNPYLWLGAAAICFGIAVLAGLLAARAR